MYSEERQEKILLIIDQRSHVSVEELANLFSVNVMTVRRDLILLENKGLLKRFHGGASSCRGRSYEPPFLVRSEDHRKEKESIGKKAAELINNGDSIAIDVGTTPLEVVRNLKEKTDLTIITSSIRVANELMDNPNFRILLTGGIVNSGEPSLIGDLAVSAINKFYVDKLFLGVGGIDFIAGLTEYNLDDAQIKKVLIQKAKDIILVTDSTKFNRIAFAFIAPINAVNRIVTDDSLDGKSIKKIKEMGIELILVKK
jgi:DeoR/GlpR family transcriptional regulator of sugar metabolism